MTKYQTCLPAAYNNHDLKKNSIFFFLQNKHYKRSVKFSECDGFILHTHITVHLLYT